MAATFRFESDAVAAATFPVVRRGYDADEVRAYLQGLAQELSRLRAEVDELRAQQAARPKDVASLDEAAVAQALGDEAVHLLTTAREAATQIRTKAEEAAATLVDDADLDAARLRQDADVEAARLRQDATERANAEVEAAKAEGREMVAEARAVRERMMADLQRRKEVARGQLEQMRLGHERVMGTFELATEALAQITDELRSLTPDVRRNTTVDTGPLPVVPPVRGRDEIAVELPADAAPSPVPVSVPRLEAGPDRPVDPDVAVDADADADADAEPPRPTVLVSAFALGEPLPVADLAPRSEPTPPKVDVEIEPADAVDVELDEIGAATDEVGADEAAVEQAPEAEPTDDAHADRHRPSAEDLFARIRAARANLASDVTELLATPAPVEVAAEPVRATVAVAVAVADLVDVIGARNEALAPVETTVARRLKRVLADEQNEVLDRLRQKNPTLELDALMGTEVDQVALYREAVRDEVWPALVAGARSLRPELDDHEVRALVDAKVEGVLAGVGDEVVRPLRERVGRAIAGANDPSTLSDALRTLYREWKTQRIDPAARLVVLTAHGQAAYAALVPGTAVCWVIDPAKPCPDGEDNALGGTTAAGEPFPTGHLCAPAYAGCRCALAPAVR